MKLFEKHGINRTNSMCLKPDAETGYIFCYIEQSNPKKILF